MEKIPTAEKFFLDNHFSSLVSDEDKQLWLKSNNTAQKSISIMIEFAKLHVEAALSKSYPLENIK